MKKMPKKRKIILKIFGKIKSNIQTSKHPISYKPTSNTAITLIALIITTIFSYDENVKFSNNKGFLLQSI